MSTSFDITNPAKPKIVKDPDAVLDYSEDWTAWLLDDDDSIVTCELIFLDGSTLMKNRDPIISDGKIVTAWLEGGTEGNTEQCTFRITTAASRIDDRTLYFSMKSR